MARVLVLRQTPEAAETADALRARGHEAVVLPLAETVALDGPPPTADVAGFVATSLQAVPALARAFPGDGRPALAVGERTCGALRAAGFTDARAGPGTAEELVRQAAQIVRADGRPLLYAAGRVRRPDFEAGATGAGLTLALWEVYDLRPRDPDEDELRQVFAKDAPSTALILSVGQAEGFSRLWSRIEGAGRAVPSLLCLSKRISSALAGDLAPFARISPQPTLSSLFDRFLPPSLDYGGSR